MTEHDIPAESIGRVDLLLGRYTRGTAPPRGPARPRLPPALPARRRPPPAGGARPA